MIANDRLFLRRGQGGIGLDAEAAGPGPFTWQAYAGMYCQVAGFVDFSGRLVDLLDTSPLDPGDTISFPELSQVFTWSGSFWWDGSYANADETLLSLSSRWFVLQRAGAYAAIPFRGSGYQTNTYVPLDSFTFAIASSVLLSALIFYPGDNMTLQWDGNPPLTYVDGSWDGWGSGTTIPSGTAIHVTNAGSGVDLVAVVNSVGLDL